MSLGATFTLEDSVGSSLARFRELSDSALFTKVLGLEVAQEVREHLIFLDGNSAHRSARSLGASPSGHYAKAARAVELESGEQSATILIPANFGLSRAFGQLEITPKNGKKWITIPAHRTAYGKRAGEFQDLSFVLLGRDLAALFARDQGSGQQFPLYWLKPKVTIPQDRDVLPSDATLSEAAELAARDWVRVVLSNVEGGQG